MTAAQHTRPSTAQVVQRNVRVPVAAAAAACATAVALPGGSSRPGRVDGVGHRGRLEGLAAPGLVPATPTPPTPPPSRAPSLELHVPARGMCGGGGGGGGNPGVNGSRWSARFRARWPETALAGYGRAGAFRQGHEEVAWAAAAAGRGGINEPSIIHRTRAADGRRGK